MDCVMLGLFGFELPGPGGELFGGARRRQAGGGAG